MGGFLFGFLCLVPGGNIVADKYSLCRLSIARSVAQAKPPRTRKARSASKEPKKQSVIATRGDYTTVEGRAYDCLRFSCAGLLSICFALILLQFD